MLQYFIRTLLPLRWFPTTRTVHELITRRQILDSPNLKEFSDDNFKFDENGRRLSQRVENKVGKGEIARYEQFFLFPQCFQKACFPGASKGVIVWEWVNPSLHRCSFQRINNRQLLKRLWEKKKLLVTSNFFFSHNVFYSIRKLYLQMTIFLTSYLYLPLKWKSPKQECEVKG